MVSALPRGDPLTKNGREENVKKRKKETTNVTENRTSRKNERKRGTKVNIMISVKILGETKPEDLSRGAAYGFSKGGAFLAKAGLSPQGTAKLELLLPVVKTPQSIRVVIGPDVKEKVSIGELLRLGGEESFVQIAPGVTQKDLAVQVIPKLVLCWLLSRCVVYGKVLKKTVSGGIPMELPVCDATVEIYEVDPIPILIPKLPDEIIERIRDFIIKPPPPPPPPIKTHVGPFPPEPSPLVLGERPITEALSSMKKAEHGTTSTRLSSLSEGESSVEVRANISAMMETESYQTLRVLALTATTDQFRQVLVNYQPLVRYVICWLRFVGVHMDLVATAKTAECGKFKAVFFRGCINPDTPDLYFKVKQKIFAPFPPVTIYGPTPVSCHTYWNYHCGTQEVTLYVTHPFARTCSLCPDINAPPNWVLFMAIGNHALSKIHGTSTDLTTTTTTENLGLTDADEPFGEILRPRIEFDNSLREDLGVKYYRVSYRKGTTGEFTHLAATINRHYTHEVGNEPVLEVYNLGPKSEKAPGMPLANKNLFEIPPPLPPIGQWTIPDAVEDTASARFDTRILAALQDPGVLWPESGIYQLKVDLFDENGNLVNIDALNVKFCVPTSKDLSGTVEAEDASHATLTNGTVSGTGLVQDDDGDGKKSMIIALHIDNSLCKAEIPAPTLDGTPAGANCGVLRYDLGPGPAKEPQGSVTISYRPEHPSGVGTAGFATYEFSLHRAENLLFRLSNRTHLPPTLSVARSASELLSGCDVAAFVEHMHVYAMATSGWRRLYEYDAHAVRGFVLAPSTKSQGPPSP